MLRVHAQKPWELHARQSSNSSTPLLLSHESRSPHGCASTSVASGCLLRAGCMFLCAVVPQVLRRHVCAGSMHGRQAAHFHFCSWALPPAALLLSRPLRHEASGLAVPGGGARRLLADGHDILQRCKGGNSNQGRCRRVGRRRRHAVVDGSGPSRFAQCAPCSCCSLRGMQQPACFHGYGSL